MPKPPSPETVFVRQHSTKSPKEIVEAAKKAGLAIDEVKVGKVRDYDKVRARLKSKSGKAAPDKPAPMVKRAEVAKPTAPAVKATKPARVKATPKKTTVAAPAPKAAAPAASSSEANLERDLRAIAVELGLTRAERILAEFRARIASL